MCVGAERNVNGLLLQHTDGVTRGLQGCSRRHGPGTVVTSFYIVESVGWSLAASLRAAFGSKWLVAEQGPHHPSHLAHTAPHTMPRFSSKSDDMVANDTVEKPTLLRFPGGSPAPHDAVL